MPVGEAWLISGNRVTNNTATLQGGGISMHGTANIIGNVITGNAASSGGGLRVAGPATVVNNLLVDNTGDSGAGVALFDSIDFINNTVTGNQGTAVGGVWAQLGSGATVSLINNILVGNTGPVADLQIVDDGGAAANIFNNDFDHSSAIIGPMTVSQQDNLDAVDPEFVDAAGGNYQLTSTSPMVDAGRIVANLPATDLLGNERLFGSSIDIGAYESQVDIPLDTDDDGIPDESDNCVEIANPDQLDTDQDGAGDACDSDDDNDRMSDADEATYSFDPLNPADAFADADGDGVGNRAEIWAGTNPLDPNSVPPPTKWLPFLDILLD